MANTPTRTHRFTPAMLSDLAWLAIPERDGGNTAAIASSLANWRHVIMLATRDNADAFERDQWNMVADSCNGFWMTSEEGPRPWNVYLAAEVEDAHRLNGAGAKWRPDTWTSKRVAGWVADTVDAIRNLDFVHACAMADAVKVFWAHTERIDHTVDAWWTVEFRDGLLVDEKGKDAED